MIKIKQRNIPASKKNLKISGKICVEKVDAVTKQYIGKLMA